MQIQLTDMVRQDSTKDPTEQESAIAYLVFDADGNERLFAEYDLARNYAELKLENSTSDIESWPVYPLYAAEAIDVM